MKDAILRKLPTSLILRQPLYLILGRAVGFQPHVYVDHQPIVTEVIKALGYDPDHLEHYGDPALGWRRKGWENPPGFDRRVLRCFLDGFQKRAKDPYTEKGPHKGLWGLTEAGVAVARELEPKANTEAPRPPRKRANATARFLEQRILETGGLDGVLWSRLRAAVKNRLPISAVSSQVEDHIQNCFMRLISRDALRGRIEAGEEIPNDKLAYFAVNAGFTDARNAGTDPVCREFYGARTERERKQHILVGPINDARVIRDIRDTEGLDAGSWADIEDVGSSMTADSTESMIQFKAIWSRVQRLVRVRKPHTGERYIQILRLKASGHTVKEIAQIQGVSTFRAASLMSEARRVVREARDRNTLKIS